jgi:hypothetical protein
MAVAWYVSRLSYFSRWIEFLHDSFVFDDFMHFLYFDDSSNEK